MSLYLQFAVLGLAAGAVYSALAVGLIAVYRATGILNFAAGAMSAWGAYTFASLRGSGDLVLPVGRIHVGVLALGPALAIGVATAAAVGLLSHWLVFRPLRRSPALAQVVASVGLMIVMQALEVVRFGGQAAYVTAILPSGTVHVLGASLSVGALLIAGIACLLALGAGAYFRFTRLGVATRAGAEDELALRLMGHSPDRLAAIVWGASIGLGGLVITLASPTVGLNPTIYTWAVIPALAVALLGRLVSIGTGCASGLALGSFQALVQFLATKSWWPDWAVTGVQDAVPFAVVVVALFVFGPRMPSRGSLGEIRLPKVTVPQLRPPVVLGTVAAGALAIVLTSGGTRFGVLTSMILVLLAMSYVVLTGFLGQISLAQLAFAGVAGFALSKLTTGWHIPFPLSILVCSSLAALVGIAVGIPAVRIRGAQLAVVTLALAVSVESFVFNNPKLTPLSGNKIADPKLFGADLAVRSGADLTRLVFCFTVLAIVVIFTLLAAQLLRGDTGRAFLAVRSNERAAASVGINVAWCKLAGFAVSAFLAGSAGTLIGYSRGQLSADSFTALTGVSLLAIVYLGGIGGISGAVVAGVTGPLGVVYTVLNDSINMGEYYVLVTGVGLVVTAIFNPIGVAGATREHWDGLVARVRARRSGSAADDRPARAEELVTEHGR